ncbi:hypothetical protein N7582_002505 [Saccharomyces uvarum]|uniref:Uncharacterized protein n=1 Tax=Saccharomyces uvarum TaxID=230603 RepID=A0AA35JL93_SACUV|nr:hypothetical protein N7582_002505 [Saccharomyces uvarum]CAI4063801.1 hypothetical protein SUVC_08G0400 [Saccharomyces uvarum]
MRFEERLQQLVAEDWGPEQPDADVLVIVLGDAARKYVESGALREHVIPKTVAGHVASRGRVAVVFLGRVKYLYMYLTRMQAQARAPRYSHVLVYGLWDLTATQDGPQQLRLLSLVLSQCLNLPSKVEFYPEPPVASVAARLLRYWEHVIG